MNDLTIEKLQYLIQGLTGKEVTAELIKNVFNEDVSMKEFKFTCQKDAGIPLPPDLRDTKYEGITLYTDDMFYDLARQKFPEGVNVYLKDWDVATLTDCIDHGFLGFGKFYTALLNEKPESDDSLQVCITLAPDEYDNLWPDPDIYLDEEMNEWINDRFAPDENGESFHCSETNFVRCHPQLTGGSLYFMEEDQEFHHRLIIEGRDFHEALSVVLQKPDITTAELRSLLRDPQQMQVFMDNLKKNRSSEQPSTMVLKGNDMFVFQYGTLGYITVDAYRVLAEYGEPLDEKVRIATREIVKTRQLVTSENKVFFISDKEMTQEPQTDYCLNRLNGEFLFIKQYQMPDGRPLYCESSERTLIPEETWNACIKVEEHLTDITTEIKKGIYGESMMVSCKVDGLQQATIELPKKILEDYHRYSYSDYKDFIILRYLAETYKFLLILGGEHKKG